MLCLEPRDRPSKRPLATTNTSRHWGSRMTLRSRRMFGYIIIGGLLGLTYLSPAHAAKTSTATQTGQAIWTNFKSSGSDSTFGYTDTETYAFNELLASAYFTMSVSGPAISCSGNTTNCAGTNQPTTPQTPTAPSFSMDRADECHFWAGSSLTEVSKSSAVTVNGANGRGNWTFTWTYTWTPNAVPAARTAWEITAVDSPGGATVTFTGTIAGLSAQKTSKMTSPKYSFSLLNADGTPRISNVAVSVDGGSPIPVESTVINALTEGFSEFVIGPSGGLSTLLAQSGTTSILTTGDARTILNNDSFAGNNNGGSTGSALAYAQLSSVRLTFTEGAHRVVLTATIKGIDGNTDVSISVTREVRIQGLGSCS